MPWVTQNGRTIAAPRIIPRADTARTAPSPSHVADLELSCVAALDVAVDSAGLEFNLVAAVDLAVDSADSRSDALCTRVTMG